MVIVTQVPLLFTLAFSLERWNMNRPDRRGFVGLDNWVDVITNADFWTIIGNTVVLTGAVVLITFVLGLTFALLLNSQFFWAGYRTDDAHYTFLDYANRIRCFMEKRVCLIHRVWLVCSLWPQCLGFLERPDIPYKITRWQLLSSLIVWQWTPFMMLILLAGLQSLSHEQLEAAQIDGANPYHLLRYVVFASPAALHRNCSLDGNLVYLERLWGYFHYDNRWTGHTDYKLILRNL